MKKILLVLMWIPTLSFAEVVIHKEDFSNQELAVVDHFWSHLYDWSVWKKTPMYEESALTANYVRKAYDLDMDEYDLDQLDEDEFIDAMGDYEGEAAFDFYDNREEVYREDVGGYSGLVTMTKVSLPLPSSFDIESLSLEEITEKIMKADQPHMHHQVSVDFAHRFLDPVHAGHAELENIGAGNVIFSVINTGRDYYSCRTMNGLLVWKSEGEGVSSFDGDFRLYNISTVKEIQPSQVSQNSTLIAQNAVKIFEQKIIYSSTLIKSGVNYVAFHEEESGQKKMVLTSIIVSTSKVTEVPGKFVNGVADGNLLLSGIRFRDGEAELNDRNVDLSPASGSCSQGLGKGMARYVYNLAQKVIQ